MKKYAVTVAALALAVFAPAADAAKPKVLGKAGGLTYVKDTEKVAGSSGSSQVAEARCPEGMVSISGGSSISGPPADSFLSGFSKVSDRQWFIEGWHLAFEEEKLVSYGICTKKGGKLVDASAPKTAPAGPAAVNATADCPDGYATGGGARLVGSATEWSVNSSFPVDDATDGDQVPDDGWRTYALHLAPADETTMIADVFCFTAGETPEYVSKEVESSIPTQTVKAKCKGDDVVMGGGAFVTGDVEDAHLVKTVPYDSKDKGKLPEDGWSVTFSNDDLLTEQTFRATAICG